METSLISIGTHKLAYSITGTPQNPNDPLVVIIPGSADVASSYAALEPLLSQHAQILLYDRSGLGRSEAGPNLITAVTSAKELHSLLEAIQQQGPILLAAHSYGGLVAREFLHLHPERVCGMVLFETATENHLDFFQVPNPNIAAVLGDLKLSQITGLREDSVLTRDQWRQRAMDIARSAAAGEAEARSGEICQTLGEKNQYERQALGSKPLSVILCKSVTEYERIYEKGVEVGNGTEVQQRAFRKLLDGWEVAARKLCEEQLRLSSQNHFVYLPDCGHNVHLTRPDVVAEEIRWVLGMVRCRETQKL